MAELAKRLVDAGVVEPHNEERAAQELQAALEDLADRIDRAVPPGPTSPTRQEWREAIARELGINNG